MINSNNDINSLKFTFNFHAKKNLTWTTIIKNIYRTFNCQDRMYFEKANYSTPILVSQAWFLLGETILKNL